MATVAQALILKTGTIGTEPAPGMLPSEWLELLERPAWMADAACVEHPELSWFVEKGESTAAAKAVCRSCLVREECLAAALANNDRHGIWGGLSEPERRPLRRAG